MNKADPPWKRPAAARAHGGGSRMFRAYEGKPLETMGRKA